MSDLQSRLIGIRTTLGLEWSPEYRQQVFDTAAEAIERIAELEAALHKIAGAPYGLVPPKYDVEWATKASTIDVAAEALNVTSKELDHDGPA